MTKKELINIASIKSLSCMAQKLNQYSGLGDLSKQTLLVIAKALIDIDNRISRCSDVFRLDVCKLDISKLG